MDRIELIAETITSLWPHRMSTDAAKVINQNFLFHMGEEVAQINEQNGWYEYARTFGEDIALLHSEVSEAFEGFRNNDLDNVHEEMADILIRLLDTCRRHNVDLMTEYQNKIAKNKTRGHKHGGKVL